jgi:hypothetical protein
MALSSRKAVAALALIVFVVGAVMAFLPVSIQRSDRIGETLACGTAIDPDLIPAKGTQLGVALADRLLGNDLVPVDDFVGQCEARVHLQQAISFPVAGAGALALLFIALTAKRRPKPAQATDDATSGAVAEHPLDNASATSV